MKLLIVSLLLLYSSISFACYKAELSEQDNFINCQLAAEKGDQKAQYNLALMYRTGKGGEQDLEQAFGWYRHAAEQENVKAQ